MRDLGLKSSVKKFPRNYKGFNIKNKKLNDGLSKSHMVAIDHREMERGSETKDLDQ